ncbi:hypothetical protein [Anaeromassilibacillus senegalensis]|uniref:hypothetical protein n=1 Tax=Anaeromassilibacillus senegalensis TaxID=1673717 RepID=UPI000682BAF7|nr:hypothetical protein [Anaeromassilibacillus senegalensis]
MLDQNDLLAIAQLMDQKLTEQETRIIGQVDQKLVEQEKHMMGRMDQKFSEINRQFEAIDQRFSEIEKQFSKIDQRFSEIDQKFIVQEKRIINQVNAIIETTVVPDIKKIAEGHHDILQRLPNVEEQAELKSRVKVLERVTMEMREDIDALKKAN